MKWFLLPREKFDNSSPQKTHSSINAWLIIIVICPVIGSLALLGTVFQWRPKTLASIPFEVLASKVNKTAAEITVKISGQDFLGSGIIFKQKNQEYLVLTNQHVLRGGEPPFQIETADGETYHAQVVTTNTSSQDDLALLTFKSDRYKYKTANIGNYSQLKTGELIFAAGFPANSEVHSNQPNNKSGFTITEGKVAIVLDKPLQEGYQIAYTNNVQKGMSGGPLLNQEGQLVGINGKHAYPLWEAPDLYEDNSQPCPSLQELITRSSLAIPVQKALELASQTNLGLEAFNNHFLKLPQNHQIFSTIATENTSHTAMEAEEISNQPCQVK